jgi:hypothetical protein
MNSVTSLSFVWVFLDSFCGSGEGIFFSFQFFPKLKNGFLSTEDTNHPFALISKFYFSENIKPGYIRVCTWDIQTLQLNSLKSGID